jgi:hypothetical protein
MTTEERLDRIEAIHAEMIQMARDDRAAYIAWKRDMESHVQSTWMAIARAESAIARTAEDNARAAQENQREHARLREEMRERDDKIDARIEKLVGAIMKLVESRNGK